MPTEGEAVRPSVIALCVDHEVHWPVERPTDENCPYPGCDAPVWVYWPADGVLETLKESSHYFAGDHVNAGEVVGDVRSRLRRFSGEGAS